MRCWAEFLCPIKQHYRLFRPSSKRCDLLVAVLLREAGAYSSLAAINPNSSDAHIAGQIANAVVGCVGGGASAQVIQRWIMDNPRAVGIALNAIGLGSLSGSSSQASVSIGSADEGRFATLAA